MSNDSFPVAELRPQIPLWRRVVPGGTRMWIATVLCAIVAAVLLFFSLAGGGSVIAISFADGHGIKPGDTLRFRGIDVGEVRAVSVAPGLDGVTVRVELIPDAYGLARAGSQFWIERPQVGLARISGLETVVGAKFIGVIPGPADAPLSYSFQGIESPPVIRDGSGAQITIEFRDGHGIATGDVVRHLGIIIGEVTAVEIAGSLSSVTVHVRLAGTAADVARAGSQFWIERPQIGLSEIRGLETLIRGPYIDFLPGAPDGPVVHHFQGLDQAPPAPRLADGLEIILSSTRRGALKPGVPVNYRGLQIGHVLSVGLATDATSVQARVYIEPDYKSLVRINSRFWSNVGLDAEFSVRGIDLKTDSLQSLAVGSIGLATPDEPERMARTGDRFDCAHQHQSEWLEWNPRIAVGQQLLPPGTARPEPLRTTIRWQQKRIGFSRTVQRQGWLLLLSDRRLIGLARYLSPDEAATEGTAVFEMSGVEFPFDAANVADGNGLASYAVASQLDGVPAWPAEKQRAAAEPEDCLIVADPQAPAVPLDAADIEGSEAGYWLVASSISYNASLDGACVISRADGALLGFLDLEKGQAMVVLIPDEPRP